MGHFFCPLFDIVLEKGYFSITYFYKILLFIYLFFYRKRGTFSVKGMPFIKGWNLRLLIMQFRIQVRKFATHQYTKMAKIQQKYVSECTKIAENPTHVSSISPYRVAQ